MESNSLDSLSKDIGESTYSSYSYRDKFARKYFCWLLRIFAMVAGFTAGLPWIETARQLSTYSVFISTMAAISVVIAFGFTSAWAFSDIVDKLTIPSHQHDDRLKQHFLCHSLGLIVTIPTIYISYRYNSKLYNVFIASMVSYGLSTAGLYQLTNVIFDTLKNNLFDKKMSRINSILSSIAFLLATMNAISVSVLSFKALQYFIISKQITIILSIGIALPLFGLDYYAMSETFFLCKRKIKEKWADMHASFILSKKPYYVYYAIPFFACLLSAFSALTDAYVVYSEVSSNILHNITILLAINMWFSKTILETYSVVLVTYNIWSIFTRKRSTLYQP